MGVAKGVTTVLSLGTIDHHLKQAQCLLITRLAAQCKDSQQSKAQAFNKEKAIAPLKQGRINFKI